MSLSLDTVLQVVELVRGAIEIYERIKDGPEIMDKIARRMRRLEALLVDLEHHLRSRSKHALARLRKTQTEQLLIIIAETREDTKKVYDLFRKWDNQVGPWELQFRFKTVAQAYFLLGTSKDKLDALAVDIEIHRRDIDSYLGLIGVTGLQANHDGIQQIRKENEAMKKQLDALVKAANKPAPEVKKAAALPVTKESAGEFQQIQKENKAIRQQLDALLKMMELNASQPSLAPSAPGAKAEKAKDSGKGSGGAKPAVPKPKSEPDAKKAKVETKDTKAKGGSTDKKEPNPKPRTKSDAKEPSQEIKDPKGPALPSKTRILPPTSPNLAWPPRPKPPPSPSPIPPRNDYRIAFVDPHNEGRSIIAVAITYLLREWTLSASGTWRIASTASAGFYVHNTAPGLTSCADEITSLLSRARASYRKPLRAPMGPDPIAIAALFDNSSYNFLPGKAKVRATVEARTAKGIQRSIFRDNDYIIVFTSREHENMLALRKELVEKDGKGAAPKGKGRLLHLGHYLRGKDGVAREIMHPAVKKGEGAVRERWNATVGEIKIAVKRMLRDEFGWRAPVGEEFKGVV